MGLSAGTRSKEQMDELLQRERRRILAQIEHQQKMRDIYLALPLWRRLLIRLGLMKSPEQDFKAVLLKAVENAPPLEPPRLAHSKPTN